MDTTREHFLSPHDCKYRFKGQNLWEMRKARLRLVAAALGAKSEGPKNDILKSVINKLDNMGAETEISEIGKKKAEDDRPAAPSADRKVKQTRKKKSEAE